jgi:hypothetical protein
MPRSQSRPLMLRRLLLTPDEVSHDCDLRHYKGTQLITLLARSEQDNVAERLAYLGKSTTEGQLCIFICHEAQLARRCHVACSFLLRLI